MTTTKTRSPFVTLSTIVEYRGSLTDYHGTLWHVIGDYGQMVTLSSTNEPKLRCRRISVNVVQVPRIIERRTDILWSMWHSHRRVIPAGPDRAWLLKHNLIEPDPDTDGRWRLTMLGCAVVGACTSWYRYGRPVRLAA